MIKVKNYIESCKRERKKEKKGEKERRKREKEVKKRMEKKESCASCYRKMAGVEQI